MGNATQAEDKLQRGFQVEARLDNVHDGKQTHGIDYLETYAAALKWSSIWLFLTQS
jgi:hypothetical protein